MAVKGFDVLCWFLSEPIIKLEDNFVPLGSFAGKEPMKFRVLGLQIHTADAVDATETNNIIVEHPFSYIKILLDILPISIKGNETAMLMKLGKLLRSQYKYIALRSDGLGLPQALEITEPHQYNFAGLDENFPLDSAMLFSKDGSLSWNFNYLQATRVLTCPIRSYFSITN